MKATLEQITALSKFIEYQSANKESVAGITLKAGEKVAEGRSIFARVDYLHNFEESDMLEIDPNGDF